MRARASYPATCRQPVGDPSATVGDPSANAVPPPRTRPIPQAPKHLIRGVLLMVQNTVTLIDEECSALYATQNEIADRLQVLLGGRKRLSEEQLKTVRYRSDVTDDAVRLSIDFGEKGAKIAIKEALMKRKSELIRKLTVLLDGDRGVMRDNMDTALYNTLKARRGGVTDEVRLQRRWLMMTDEPVPAAPIVVPAVAAPTIIPAPAAAAPAAAAHTAPLTKNGEPDKRFSVGKK